MNPNIDLAVQAVLSGQMTQYKASQEFGVNQSTISRRLRKIELGQEKIEPRPVCPCCGQPIARQKQHR